MEAVGPKFAMEMTWEWWFSLSLGEKRKKKYVPKNGRSDPSISCFREGVRWNIAIYFTTFLGLYEIGQPGRVRCRAP